MECNERDGEDGSRTATDDAPAKKLADGRKTREHKQLKWRAKHQGDDRGDEVGLCGSSGKKRLRSSSPSGTPPPGSCPSSPRGVPSSRVREWVALRDNAYLVTLDDVEEYRSTARVVASAPPLGDLLAPYWDLQKGGHRSPPPPSSAVASTAAATPSPVVFVAEGTETVRLLLQQVVRPPPHLDSVSVVSVFCKVGTLIDPPNPLATDLLALEASERTRRKEQETREGPDPSPRCTVLVAADARVLSRVAGFPVARGALACGIVPSHRRLGWLLDEYLPRCSGADTAMAGVPRPQRTPRLRLLALDGASDPANLGSALRCSSAFGVHAVLLTGDCADPWYRRSIRVSMGHVFRVPCVQVSNLAQALQILQDRYDVVPYAAVVCGANLVLERMERGSVGHSWCCVVGNESRGISATVLNACAHRIRIGMQDGVDSLSVPLATGILLHGLREREGPLPGASPSEPAAP